MNKIILTLILILVCSISYAGDYVCYGKEGKIIGKYYSVGLRPQGQCIKISREKFKSLTRWNKVDTSVIDNKEKKDSMIIEMTQEEKDIILTPSILATQEQVAKVLALKTKLKELGLTDEESNMVISGY